MDEYYKAYSQLCRMAVADEEVFSRFRRDPVCITVVDGCWKEIGKDCIDNIYDAYPHLFEHLYLSDTIGNPVTFYYDKIGMTLSPTTLRYAKTAVDITSTFDLSKMHVIEIGVGYGGQCKVLHDMVKPKSYTLVDFPEVLALAKKWLGKFGVKPILRDMDDTSHKHYDLVISNFAFSEMSPYWQRFYCTHIISKVPRGFMVCNVIKPEQEEKLICKDNILMTPEYPLTGDGNFVCIWNDGK